MNRIKQLCLITVLCCGLAALPLSATVTIKVQGKEYQYPSGVRLITVLQGLPLRGNVYWPAAQLHRTDTAAPDALRKQVLDNLATAISDSSGAKRQAFISLQRHIASWQLAHNTGLTIDYDLARFRAPLNPALDAGAYTLTLPERAREVQVFMPDGSATTYPLVPLMPLSQQLKALPQHAASHPDQVFIIRPDGAIQQVGIGHWNRDAVQLMPGSRVFIPFSPSLFSNETDRLNLQIAQLLAHKVVP